MGNVVLLVAREVDDFLALFRFRRLGRPLPFGLRPGIFGDRRFGVGDDVGAGERSIENCRQTERAGEKRLALGFGFHRQVLPF